MPKSRLADLQRLARQASYRRQTGLFLIEGTVLTNEAIRAGLKLREIWVEEPRADRDDLEAVAAAESGGAVQVSVRPDTLAKVKASVTPPPVLAVAEIPTGAAAPAAVPGAAPAVAPAAAPAAEPAAPAAPPGVADFNLAAVDLSDPANAGALLRCAEGAGVGEVVFAGSCVDCWGPKTVRASAGSVFRVRPRQEPDAASYLRSQADDGRRVIATAADRGQPYDQVDFTHPTTIVVGNETHGLPDAAAKHISGWTHIPLGGAVESLNVATAAAVICFEARRQQDRRQQDRRQASQPPSKSAAKPAMTNSDCP